MALGPEPPGIVLVHLRISEDVLRQLDEIAESRELTRSDIVREALRMYLKAKRR